MLSRLLKALESEGLSGRGIVTKVAKATGYTTGTVSPLLAGKEPLNNRFIHAICSAYGINEDWVRTGEGDMFDKIKMSFDPDDLSKIVKETMENIIRRRQQPGAEPYVYSNADLDPLPPPDGLIPVIGMGSANGDGPCWEDAYPVGHGMQMIHRPHDVIDPKAFGVKVDGDSMSPKYEDGDIVVVCPQKQVTSGMPVVVKLADGRVMIKRIRYVNDHVLLESINSNYEPIFVDRDQVEFAYKIVWTKGG